MNITFLNTNISIVKALIKCKFIKFYHLGLLRLKYAIVIESLEKILQRIKKFSKQILLQSTNSHSNEIKNSGGLFIGARFRNLNLDS